MNDAPTHVVLDGDPLYLLVQVCGAHDITQVHVLHEPHEDFETVRQVLRRIRKELPDKGFTIYELREVCI